MQKEVVNKENFNYSFNNYTPEQLIYLANRINVLALSQGRAIMVELNGVYYNRNIGENDDYFCLLSYIKFIGGKMESYLKYSVHLNSIGFDVPNIYEYVNSLMNNIKSCIDYNIDKNRRICPKDILSFLGQKEIKVTTDDVLYDVIDLYLKEKGFFTTESNQFELEKTGSFHKNNNLSVLADDILNTNQKKKLILNK